MTSDFWPLRSNPCLTSNLSLRRRGPLVQGSAVHSYSFGMAIIVAFPAAFEADRCFFQLSPPVEPAEKDYCSLRFVKGSGRHHRRFRDKMRFLLFCLQSKVAMLVEEFPYDVKVVL